MNKLELEKRIESVKWLIGACETMGKQRLADSYRENLKAYQEKLKKMS